MHVVIFKKIGVGKLASTCTTLQLSDRSIRQPCGFMEDVLVKVGKFTFRDDFYIIDMDEDRKIPILLGRAFLTTSECSTTHASSFFSLPYFYGSTLRTM